MCWVQTALARIRQQADRIMDCNMPLVPGLLTATQAGPACQTTCSSGLPSMLITTGLALLSMRWPLALS